MYENQTKQLFYIMFEESDKSILKRIDKIESLGGMTVNERLYCSDLDDAFYTALINDQPRAKQILRWLKVDEASIDSIVK